MQTRDFHFELPDELIAQQPAARRTDSRLLVLDREDGSLADHRFSELLDFLSPEDCLVFNDTRVIPARLYGHKSTGGKLEILIERLLDDHRALAHIRASKSPKPGSQVQVRSTDDQLFNLTVTGREGEFFSIRADDTTLSDIMLRCGHMPLPPYIDREDEAVDQERYQTVYAANPGAVAAPTAGLHFDDDLLEAIDSRNISRAFVTLHVGAGTFQPVRSENIEDHHMHSEYLEVSQQTVETCRQARSSGGRIIAVGTTSVRCLESASQTGRLEAFKGDTDIFIYPGYTFKSVDAMITNFHLPESTLLMLVSAFSGRENIRRAYHHAIDARYRFFSYGDAMLLV